MEPRALAQEPRSSHRAMVVSNNGRAIFGERKAFGCVWYACVCVLPSCMCTPTPHVCVSHVADDPFRPKRHPLAPVMINILQKVLEADPEELSGILEGARTSRVTRSSDGASDGTLLAEEWDQVKSTCVAVIGLREALEEALQTAIEVDRPLRTQTLNQNNVVVHV